MLKIRHKKLTIGAMLALALLSAVALVVGHHVAYADPPTITQTSLPTGFPLPGANLFTHGDGTVTLSSSYSGSTNTTPVITSLKKDDISTVDQTILYKAANWQVLSTIGARLVGADQTVYFAQQNTTAPLSGAYRIVAERDNIVLWTKIVPSVGCSSSAAALVDRLTLGYDGNIYGFASDQSCSNPRTSLISFNAATGNVRFTTDIAASSSMRSADTVKSYEDGLMVTANGVNAYYYTYSGSKETSKTFSPSLPSGVTSAYVVMSSIHPDGRTVLGVQGYITINGLLNSYFGLFSKDTDSSTITQVSIPGRSTFTLKSIASTPDNGFAVVIGSFTSSSDRFLEYFDNTGSLVYEKVLSSDAGGYSNGAALAIDNLGNALIAKPYVQSSNPNDTNVLVDSYSPTGAKTQLLNSEQTFGTSGRDQFGFLNNFADALGDGKLYIVLCHTTYGYTPDCTNTTTTKIVSVPMAGSFDYSRSAIFNQAAQKHNYIAMGDSYSAGEGLNPFIPPSDTSECDRSYQAYPSLLTANSSLNLDLRAFVACSGHTTIDMATSQLAALSDSTDIVTLTAGGNDALFKDFAKECVINTCDATSSEYQATMDVIDNDLQDSVENLLTGIRTSAPNAVVYVMGYPNVVPTGSACSFFSLGEEIAANTVVTGINNKLQLAAQNMGSGFTFLDPTAAGSPFLGHELCSSDPYFFGLNIAEHRFSFHPNADGQAAYASMVEAAL